MNQFSNHWIYESVGNLYFQGENPYTKPDSSEEIRKSISRISDYIRKIVEKFSPNNISIWNALFSNWEHIINEIEVNLIVGLPDKFDALAIPSPTGSPQAVFDVGNWVSYEKKHNISEVVHNLLTHELCYIYA